MAGVRSDWDSRNKQAWDLLYRATEDLVWGEPPIAFLRESLDWIPLPPARGACILDAATGEGRNVRTLLATGANVQVCEYSEAALQKLVSKLDGSVSAVRCDLSQTPYQSDCFDLVVLTDVIETLAESSVVLREIRRILRVGGHLLCNIPGLEDGISADNMARIEGSKYLYRDRYFFQFLSDTEALELIRRNGFAIVRVEKMSWLEESHPGFRPYRHRHTSRVILAKK